MQVTDELIRSVVQEVLLHMGNGHVPRTATVRPKLGRLRRCRQRRRRRGEAQKQFETPRPGRSPQGRRLHPPHLQRTGRDARPRGAGRDADRPARAQDRKAQVIADRIPGVEFLRTDAFSGENGITLQEYAPFGVIGVITPGDALAADAGLQRHQHAGGRQRPRLQPAPQRRPHRLQGSSALQPGDPRRHRHRQPHHHHREADAGIRPGDLRSPRRPAAVRHRRPRRWPGGAAKSQAGHRRRAGQSRRSSWTRPPTSTTPPAPSSSAAAYDNNLLCIGEKEVFRRRRDLRRTAGRHDCQHALIGSTRGRSRR